MRLIVLYVVATLAALTLQTGGLHMLPLGNHIPDLILILAVYLGLKHHTALAAIIAFVMGYATDVFSGSQIGLNAFMITLIFLLAYEASRHLMVTNDFVGSIAVFFAVIIKVFGVFAVTGSFRSLSDADAGMMRVALLQGLLTAIVAPFVFASLSGGKRLMGLPDRQEDD